MVNIRGFSNTDIMVGGTLCDNSVAAASKPRNLTI